HFAASCLVGWAPTVSARKLHSNGVFPAVALAKTHDSSGLQTDLVEVQHYVGTHWQRFRHFEAHSGFGDIEYARQRHFVVKGRVVPGDANRCNKRFSRAGPVVSR